MNYEELSYAELNLIMERNYQNGFLDLDPIKKALVHEYIANGFDINAAGRDALSMSCQKAKRILREPLVSAYVAYLQQKSYQSSIICKDYITAQYLHLMEIALGNEAVPMIDKDGTEFSGKKFFPMLAGKVIEKLSTLVPEYNPKQEIIHKGTVVKMRRKRFNGELDNSGDDLGVDVDAEDSGKTPPPTPTGPAGVLH